MRLLSSFNTTIAARLKELRANKGLSEVTAAEEIGVTRQTIANYECESQPPKQPTIAIVGQMADYYGVSIDYLTGRIDQTTHDNKFICEDTGLSEGALDYIRQLPGRQKDILNKLLSSESGLSAILENIALADYVSCSAADLEGKEPTGQTDRRVIDAIKTISSDNSTGKDKEKANQTLRSAELFQHECKEEIRTAFSVMIKKYMPPEVYPPELLDNDSNYTTPHSYYEVLKDFIYPIE